MIAFLVLMAQTPPAADAARGARIFAESCAVGYCHGSGGSVGRAPRLAGRGFDRANLVKVVRDGIAGTGMPGFAGRLAGADLTAVVNYVMKLSGGAAPPPPPDALPSSAVNLLEEGPPAVRRGRDLFFEAARGVRCGTCHALEGRGIPVGPNPGAARAITAAGIRRIKSPNVKTASTPDGDRFPALLVERNNVLVRVYDLTVAPPVLRSFAPAETSTGDGAGWSHQAFIGGYTDPELEAVAAYLRWLAAR